MTKQFTSDLKLKAVNYYHGVIPITSGERYVIVSFCKFS